MAFTGYNPLVVALDCTAAGSPTTATSVRPLKIVDASAYVTTAAGQATSAQVSSSTGAVTDDFSLGNNNANKMGRAGQIDDAHQAVASGTAISAAWTGAGTAGRVSVILIDNS